MPCIAQAPVTPLREAEEMVIEAFQAPLISGEVQGASAGVTQAQRQALAAYWHAVQEYETRRTIKHGWLPMDRSTILVPLALRVEYARQRLVALGITPETL
jgi:hypothetical protein